MQESLKQGKEVIDRCNLTVLFLKGQENTAQFLKDNKVKIVASLPCYTSENVEKQRGDGVFKQSIEALKILNNLGYGREKDLTLDLVYNPIGAHLPPDQSTLAKEYRTKLGNDFQIEFNQLFTITNMPIKRFLFDLKRQKKYHEYMTLLASSFNENAFNGVMCRSLISVSWDGYFYDCDFNQMLGIDIKNRKRSIWDVESLNEFNAGPIAIDDHCYGCTAGVGSSCSGTVS